MSDVESEPADDEEAQPAPIHATFSKPEPGVTDTQEDVLVSPTDALEAERDKLKDQLLRTAADFDNFRKRTRKDLEQAERRGRETMLRDLLPVIDNLERAVEASLDVQDIAAVRNGIQMVLKLFDDTASRIELTRVAATGARFDPNLHDALQQLETTDYPPGTVIRVYQHGYMFGGKLLRPAMVVVARKPPDPPSAQTSQEETDESE